MSQLVLKRCQSHEVVISTVSEGTDMMEQEQGVESELSSMSGVTQVKRGSSHLQRSKLKVSLPISDDLIMEKKIPHRCATCLVFSYLVFSCSHIDNPE